MLIPNYAWEPHKTTLLDFLEGTADVLVPAHLNIIRQRVIKHVHSYIDRRLYPQINDIMYLSVYSGLRHTTDLDTQGLASDRIPSNNTADKTLRFLIAFIHEKHLAIDTLIRTIVSYFTPFIPPPTYALQQYPEYPDVVLEKALVKWTNRADKIVDIMDTARSKVGAMAAKAEFIRNWALVDLKEEIGVEATAANNNINISFTDPTNNNTKTTSQLLATKTMKVIKLEDAKLPPVGHRNNDIDTLTITSRNGANFYNIKDSAGNWSSDAQLAKDASKTFTFTEATYGIKTRPIAPPAVYEKVTNQSLNVAVVQSVSLDMTFTGVLLTITAESDDEAKVTVVVTESGAGLAITGVAAGTATITVTATNPSGSISTTFDVTVTEASGD